jgi:Protein of unknown function (DUF1822)
MTSFQANPTDLRLLLPETTFLEPHQVAQAQTLSHAAQPDEGYQWQTYIQALALLGFTQWLGGRLMGTGLWVDPDQAAIWQSHVMVQLGEFKLCLIAAEQALDEMVSVPEMAIALTAAHFYLFIEVVEEQAQVMLRGLIRYDQLVQHLGHSTGRCYELPLATFDAEPNHLLFYCRFLQPSAIALPVKEPVTPAIKLGDWLQDVFVEGWQAIDAMLDPQLALAFSTRNPELGAARGKLIDLEMQIGQQTMALIVNITQEAENKFGVLVQLHPTGGLRYLPASLKLLLLSKAGNVLQEVESRSQDNYIQLRPFKGEQGKCFSLEVSFGTVQLKEDFVL